ncbi:phosphatidylserine decarboxylase family protein [Saccharothrix sp. NPDC042600]|uniref:phosphatidylserine decarboxylase family protein n=1 Tax=Saccharothrix TaxID=2071 RepID=UPI0033D174B4|nr:phosphatidylserine decarboxylase family protein [Saccharothrix mutabilis subsp. capreolus]
MSADIAVQAGDWLPTDQVFLAHWLDELVKEVDEQKRVATLPMELDDSLARFREFVYANAEVYVLFTDMFEQLSQKVTPTGYPQVRSFEQMLELVDKVVRTVPVFNSSGLVGFPINVILNWAMGTQAGFAAFLNKEVNQHLKVVLDGWGRFLESPDSRKPMKDGNWLSPRALEAMSDPGRPFTELFDCDPDDEYLGFTSWNHFFTRSFRNVTRDRPVATGDEVIASACEAAPYRIRKNVERYEHFSVKGQPYSLAHLLDTAHKADAEPDVGDFVGGTVYQGFLAALNYHQWHSPVDGKVVATRIVPGSYYSEAPAALCDPAAPDISQGYIAHVATRALIFIEAANPRIGVLCFVAIGMAEVSSCKLDDKIKPGAGVVKGQRLGEFRYGGSSHCLVFRPGVELDFVDAAKNAEANRDSPTKILVNAKLATVGGWRG